MAANYSIQWTEEASERVDEIYNIISSKWGDKAASNFLDRLQVFENTIKNFPYSYKTSAVFKGCHLGFVHKHVTAVYKLEENTLTIITVLDNRSGIDK